MSVRILRAAGAALPLVVLAMPPAQAAEPSGSVVVLSASRGMKRAVQGRGALDLAREALGWRLGGGARDGLVVFGGRSARDCKDIEALGKPGAIEAAAGFGKLAALKPVGQAPVAEALRVAAELLPAGQPGMLLLVTEGADSCKGDPCAAAVALKGARPELTIDVLGFDAKSKDKLACVAGATGGTARIAASAMDVFAALAAAAGDAPAAAPARKPGEAFVEAPKEVEAGDLVVLPFDGPREVGAWVGLSAAGDKSLSYSYEGSHAKVTDASPAKVTAPAKPGDYEARYVSGAGKLLFSAPVKVTASKASLEAPESAPASWPVPLSFTGPDGPANYVTIVAPGKPTHEKDNNRSSEVTVSAARLRAPVEPGDYEIRYVLSVGDNQVLARRPLKVTERKPVALPSTSGKAGTRVPVEIAEAPRVAGDQIYVCPKTAAPTDRSSGWTYSVPAAGPVTIYMPDKPGAWEMRYLSPNYPNPIVLGAADLTIQPKTP